MRDILKSIEKKKRLNEGGSDLIARVLRDEPVERLPLIFWRPRNASVPGTSYNFKEQFLDAEKMLHGQLEEIDDVRAEAFDAQLCARPNFGTIFIPAMFGLKYELSKDKYPWLTSRLSKKEIENFRMPDLDGDEMMARALEHIAFFKKSLPDFIHVYQPDTQGPFDIAHLVRGDELFLDLHDDPAFVHHLMSICVEMYVAVTKRLKSAIGEKSNACYHGHALPRGIFMNNGGVRVSEDSATLISPAHIHEFVVPYVACALKEFGGGFIHYCGKNDALFEAFSRMDGVRAINFGNPESHNVKATMKTLLDHGKCYFGLWPKNPGETLAEYVARMKSVSEEGTRGLLLHFDETMFPETSREEILARWNQSYEKRF